MKTREALQKQFRLSSKKLSSIINFLLQCGLITEEKGQFKSGIDFIRIGNDTPWITQHHTNWRQRAIDNLERQDLYDLHYSGVYTLSQSDALKIKNFYLDTIQNNAEIVKNSNEEQLYVINIDFFNLLK